MRQHKHLRKNPSSKSRVEKSGFTLVEVMLVLGITCMMLIGMLGGTFSTISRQRYLDALRSMAEYLSRQYGEALSPVSLGSGNSNAEAILGKIIVFGHDYGDDTENRRIYSATLVGPAKPAQASSNQSFSDELRTLADDPENLIKLYCGSLKDGDEEYPSTVEYYDPLWESTLQQDARGDGNPEKTFQGTLIIARTPTSSTLHTVFAKDTTYNLKDECQPDNQRASDSLRNDLKTPPYKYAMRQVGFCVKNRDSNQIREILIAEDGRNSSAIATLPEDASACQPL